MSAVAVFVAENGIAIAADGVSYDRETGVVVAPVSKVKLYPERNTIIAWTGIGLIGHALDFSMPVEIKGFDGLLDILPHLFRRTIDRLVEEGLIDDAPAAREAAVVLAGYSETRFAYEAYRILSYRKRSINSKNGETATLEPWQLLPIASLYCSYSIEPATQEAFGLHRSAAWDNPIDLCVRYICAARAESGVCQHGDATTYFNAGMFVQTALLQKDHQHSQIAHRWPEDVVGEPIDPTRGERMPAYLIEQDREYAQHDKPAD